MKTILNGAEIASDNSDIHADLTQLTSDVADVNTLVDTAIVDIDAVDTELEIVEVHEHSYLRWFGATAGQTAASTANPAVTTGLTAFSVTANATAATWGTAVEVYHHNEEWDTKGTPAFFDIDKIFIADVGKTGTWRLQIAHGDNATGAAAAFTAQNYTGLIFKMTASDADGEAINIQTERIPVTDSVWVRAMSSATTGGACTFMWGAHCYTA